MRIWEVAPTITQVNATPQVRVQYTGGSIIECGLQNSVLTLFRYS